MDGPRTLLAVALVAVVLAGCTGVGGDSDDDGLPDEDEETPREIKIKTAQGLVFRNVTSDPDVADTDGDGLDDFQEFKMGTDPMDVDTDGDRLADGPNVTNPDPDLRQRLESANVIEKQGTWIGEEDYCTDGSISPTDWDSDSPQLNGQGDGIPDGDEVVGWNATPRGEPTHVQSSPCIRDTDGDSLNDADERERSTDPTDPDTDGDGVEDQLDADPLWDLSLTVTLDSFTLETSKDEAGGADLRFGVQIGQTRDRFYRNVSSTGTYQLDERYEEVPVDDQSPRYREKAVDLIVSVWDEDPATDDEPVDFSSAGNQPRIGVHLFNETATLGSDVVGTDGAATLSGTEAELSMSFETVRS